MNIHIIRNNTSYDEEVFIKDYVIRKKYIDSQFDGVKQVKYYLYLLKDNHSFEIEPDIAKFDMVNIHDIKPGSTFVYFAGVREESQSNDKCEITVYRYDVVEKTTVPVYTFCESMDKYAEYMRTRIFAVNEHYLIIQNEFIRDNLMGNYSDYMDFELSMYSVNDNKLYKIHDEVLNQYGIAQFKPVTNNICVLKTGFSLLKDNRFKLLEKSEASMETVSFVNIGQMVSDILLEQKNVVMDTIENVYYTATIPYMKVEKDYVIYSKVKLEDNYEEEIVFYNFTQKESCICINNSIGESLETARTCIIGDNPFVIIKKSKGYEFIDLTGQKSDILLEGNNDIRFIKKNIIITVVEEKGLLGKVKPYIMVYQYPSMKLLHKEKGVFIDARLLRDKHLYIIAGQNNK